MSECGAGNTGSSRCRNDSSEAAISPGRSSSRSRPPDSRSPTSTCSTRKAPPSSWSRTRSAQPCPRSRAATRRSGSRRQARVDPRLPKKRLTRDERRIETRTDLLDAASRVFARQGFHAATLEDVAREAGYTTGAIYSNFAGKDELFLAAFEHQIANDVR